MSRNGLDIKSVTLSGLIAAVTVLAVLWWGQPFFRGPRSPGSSNSPITFPTEAAVRSELTAEEQSNISVYKEVSPGVVNITSRAVEYEFFFEPVVREGAGSGSIVDYDGHVVTNYHVIQDAEQLEVTLLDKSTYRAEVQGVDELNDLAVLRIRAPTNKLRPIKIGNSDALQVGQKVLAIGNPFKLQGTLTVGVVSALNRTIKTGRDNLVRNVIQTDAAVNQGNSGGPLLNSVGEMIGVNTLIFSPSGGNIGIGFAIPSTTLKRVINDLIQYGKVIRPWLGISGQPISPELAQLLRLPVETGVLVRATEPEGPAERAGIHGATRRILYFNLQVDAGGDIITEFEKKPVTSVGELLSYLEEKKAGDTVTLTIIRGSRKLRAPVQLGAPPRERGRFQL